MCKFYKYYICAVVGKIIQDIDCMDLLRFTVYWNWMSCPLVGETNIPEKPTAPHLEEKCKLVLVTN